ncbi:ATP-binding protein, partial [Streptomyces sp. NPDC059900]
ETLAEANRRIEQSEALDLFDSDQLGLFVVSRLAARHGVKVHLRTSPYGGTTAVVLLPTALLQSATPESPGAHTMERDREQNRHARVPEAAPVNGKSVPAPAARPALAPSAEAPETTAPGVTALRLHKAPETEPDSVPKPSDDLPRRVRQASLAPQLRERPPGDAAGPVSVRETSERSPEEVRERMTAYRDGWARGGGRRPGIVGAVPGIPGPGPASDSTEGDPA